MMAGRDMSKQMVDEFIVVWDIETVPDLEAFAEAKRLTSLPTAQIRTALGDAFPKLTYHRIVCIGALISMRTDEGWRVRSLGAPHIGQRTEADLIRSFVDRLFELNPRLVTFNGTSFDLPVLRYRAMKFGVAAPALSRRPYFNRYTDDAIDLCDILSSFDARARVSLDEISRVLGLPGKPSDINGAQVEEYFNQGRIGDIAKYCEIDVVNTYRVWLRYELFRGTINQSQHELSEMQLAAFLQASDVA